ncbi:MAG: urease accessory protein UreF [Polaromonas sp.]|nr:urease accessory protein UreF [Polaromonas sp.]
MGRTATMVITTDLQAVPTTERALPAASLLQLIWLASPALPVGGFSYSEGLEAAILRSQAGPENIADDLANDWLGSWLSDQLQLTLAQGDLAVIAQAIPAWRSHQLSRITQLNDWLLQTRETSELRAQAEQMGRSLCNWLRNHDGIDAAQLSHCEQLPPTYPIAFALAAAQTEASVRDCLLTYAFGWAENMAQAAIKSVPLGQTAGQRILARLSQAIPAAVQTAMDLPDDERQAFSPMLAILSAQHETQYSRLFRS